jgi:hypothetical protein
MKPAIDSPTIQPIRALETTNPVIASSGSRKQGLHGTTEYSCISFIFLITIIYKLNIINKIPEARKLIFYYIPDCQVSVPELSVRSFSDSEIM